MCSVAGGVVDAERDQVVVVEGDAVRAALGEPVHGLDRVERGPGRVTERVAGLPAHRPEAEGELVRAGRRGLRRPSGVPSRDDLFIG